MKIQEINSRNQMREISDQNVFMWLRSTLSSKNNPNNIAVYSVGGINMLLRRYCQCLTNVKIFYNVVCDLHKYVGFRLADSPPIAILWQLTFFTLIPAKPLHSILSIKQHRQKQFTTLLLVHYDYIIRLELQSFTTW